MIPTITVRNEICVRPKEERLQKATHVRMQVFGMLYKQGAARSSFSLRLWIMDGAKISYYKLGDTKPRGNFFVHTIRAIEQVFCDNVHTASPCVVQKPS